VLLTGAELATPLDPRKWASEWLGIAPGRPAILCGEGGSRKGWLSMAALLLGAAGMPLWGHEFTPGMRGVYFDWEQTLYETKLRFQLLARGYGIDLASLGTRLGYMWMPTQSLANEGAREEMCKRVDGFDMAVIDSTRASTVGVKENSEEASYAGQTLTTVSEKTGCSFMMLDHSGLPDTTGLRQRQHAIRGHSSKRDISSTLLVMSTKKGEGTLVTCERCQGKPVENWMVPFQFSLTRTQNGGVILVDLPPKEEKPETFEDQARVILKYLIDNPEGVAGVELLSEKVRMGEKRTGAVVASLEAEGKVVRLRTRGVRGNGCRILYHTHATSVPF